MHPIRKKIIADESMRPIAVQIDYADWLEVERLLGLQDSGNRLAGPNGVTRSAPRQPSDPNRLAGTLTLRIDPVAYQRGEREDQA